MNNNNCAVQEVLIRNNMLFTKRYVVIRNALVLNERRKSDFKSSGRPTHPVHSDLCAISRGHVSNGPEKGTTEKKKNISAGFSSRTNRRKRSRASTGYERTDIAPLRRRISRASRVRGVGFDRAKETLPGGRFASEERACVRVAHTRRRCVRRLTYTHAHGHVHTCTHAHAHAARAEQKRIAGGTSVAFRSAIRTHAP